MQPKGPPPFRSQRRSATRTLAGFAFVATAAISGCGLVPASPPIAQEQPFEGDAAAATDWTPIELTFAGGTTLTVGTLDAVGPALRRYFSLSVRPIDENAVKVVLPSGIETAEAFRVLVVVTGGVNPGQAGSQVRVWLRRNEGGWNVDAKAEIRFFCRFGIGGLSGRSCAGA